MEELKNYLMELNSISESCWEDTISLFTPQTYAKHNYFIQDGEIATHLGFLKKGIMRAFYRDPNGTEYNKHFFIAPCFIGGFSSLITGKPNQINQQALSECEIIVANYSQFKRLYDVYPEMERISRLISEQFFVQKEEREIDLVLLQAKDRYKKFRKEFPQLEQQVSQYHIASYLGVSATQLSRIRRKLANS